MRVLLTGNNGQVGFCLTKLLAKKEWDVLSLDKSQLDITDFRLVEKKINEFLPDIVINASAYTAVDKAESDIENAYNVNSLGARNLAQAAKTIGAAIFHISTDYVFSGEAVGAYIESDATSPQGVYGASKLEGEHAVIAANPKHIVMRTSWVFGEHGNNFVKTMIRLGRDRQQLGIVSDQQGGPTYAGDIADALIKIASQYEKDKDIVWGTYHFSGLPHTNWFQFAESIFAEVEAQNVYAQDIPVLKPITTADYPTPAKRPSNSCLDCTKIRKVFGIDASNWEMALKNIKAYS